MQLLRPTAPVCYTKEQKADFDRGVQDCIDDTKFIAGESYEYYHGQEMQLLLTMENSDE